MISESGMPSIPYFTANKSVTYNFHHQTGPIMEIQLEEILANAQRVPVGPVK